MILVTKRILKIANTKTGTSPKSILCKTKIYNLQRLMLNNRRPPILLDCNQV